MKESEFLPKELEDINGLVNGRLARLRSGHLSRIEFRRDDTEELIKAALEEAGLPKDVVELNKYPSKLGVEATGGHPQSRSVDQREIEMLDPCSSC